MVMGTTVNHLEKSCPHTPLTAKVYTAVHYMLFQELLGMVNMKGRKLLASDYAVGLICAVVMLDPFLEVPPW